MRRLVARLSATFLTSETPCTLIAIPLISVALPSLSKPFEYVWIMHGISLFISPTPQA